MNSAHRNQNVSTSTMAWYKVPILWLMISLLGFTVVSGLYLFFLAHDTKDSIVLDQQHVPLNKKQAHSSSTSKTKD